MLKFSAIFFASTAGFRQNLAEFFAKPSDIQWPNYRQIWPIIWLIRPNFVFPKFSYSFSTAFRPNFPGLQ
jgi:hypothetical protein